MSFECGECGQKEKDDEKINALCHHCGKPLCNKHSVRISDDAFADFAETVSNIAFHCDSCKRKYHPRATALQIMTKR